MAHVVPKREPCLKCNLPVFFAERLVVEKKLFHRSCLKCARCDSKLTLGNFYETEEDNVFCCETCPDEETVQTRDEKPAESGRLSMAQRISMFEKDQSVLKKSLSDEEKSRSLKRQAEIQDLKSPASTKALNSFLAAQIDENHNKDQEQHDKVEDTSSSESDDEPPPLPREAQPQINTIEISDFSDNLENVNQLVGTSIVTKDLFAGEEKIDDEFDAILKKMAEDDEKSKIIQKTPEIVKEIPTIEESIKAPENSEIFESHEITSITDLAITTPVIFIESIPETPAITHESSTNELLTTKASESFDIPIEIESPTKIEELPEKTVEKPLNNDTDLKIVPEVVVESTENTELINDSKDINLDVQKDEIKEVNEMEADTPVSENIVSEIRNDSKPGDFDYPDDLNPFGDDEDEPTPIPVKIHVSSNPFGSEDEDEMPVNRSGTLKPPRPPPPKIKPANPFGDSDEEDSISEANTPRRMPVPTPRKIG